MEGALRIPMIYSLFNLVVGTQLSCRNIAGHVFHQKFQAPKTQLLSLIAAYLMAITGVISHYLKLVVWAQTSPRKRMRLQTAKSGVTRIYFFIYIQYIKENSMILRGALHPQIARDFSIGLNTTKICCCNNNKNSPVL